MHNVKHPYKKILIALKIKIKIIQLRQIYISIVELTVMCSYKWRYKKVFIFD